VRQLRLTSSIFCASRFGSYDQDLAHFDLIRPQIIQLPQLLYGEVMRLRNAKERIAAFDGILRGLLRHQHRGREQKDSE
jgi:hypothetical protein